MADEDIQGLADDVEVISVDLNKKADKKAQKADKKQNKKVAKEYEQKFETIVPNPRDRYRALTDLLDTYNDISEMADKKTRFALVILGAMNTVNLLIVARPEVVLGQKKLSDPFIIIYLATYVILSLFLFAKAISTLRPRVGTLFKKLNNDDPILQQTLGLRLIGHVHGLKFEDYYDKWNRAKYSEINREVALSIQMVAGVIISKYRQLHLLYTGLMVLVFLSATLILYVGYIRVTGQ